MIALTIYFAGSAVTYWRMRRTWIRNNGWKGGWARILCCMFAAAISWLGLVVAVALDDSSKNEPPKWL